MVNKRLHTDASAKKSRSEANPDFYLSCAEMSGQRVRMTAAATRLVASCDRVRSAAASQGGGQGRAAAGESASATRLPRSPTSSRAMATRSRPRREISYTGYWAIKSEPLKAIQPPSTTGVARRRFHPCCGAAAAYKRSGCAPPNCDLVPESPAGPAWRRAGWRPEQERKNDREKKEKRIMIHI